MVILYPTSLYTCYVYELVEVRPLQKAQSPSSNSSQGEVDREGEGEPHREEPKKQPPQPRRSCLGMHRHQPKISASCNDDKGEGGRPPQNCVRTLLSLSSMCGWP